MDNLEKKEQRSQLVVKGNDLIRKARYRLTATQQKFIAYLVSMIKPTDENFKEYSIRVEDFCLLAGIDKTYFYTEFRKMIDDLDESGGFWVETDSEIYKFRWFDDTTYLKGEGTVKIILSKRLKEYLIGLTKNFTQYELYNILGLKSKYSIRLFELFKSYSYQKNKKFGIDALKEILCAENYANFKDFRRRVLEPAMHEINEYTELHITYNAEKKGRKVISVIFTIDKKEPSERFESYKKTVSRITKEKQMAG